MGEKRDTYMILVVKPEERRPLVNPCVDGRIILKWIFEKWDVGHELNRSSSEQGQVASSCECGYEPTGSIKCGEFLE
jgi:hypothetical protein